MGVGFPSPDQKEWEEKLAMFECSSKSEYYRMLGEEWDEVEEDLKSEEVLSNFIEDGQFAFREPSSPEL
jgi:hypothetical protein